MVWGGITGNSRTPLVVINGNLTGARYRDEILQAHVVPFVRQHAVTLQHDNARPHVARVVTDFLTRQNVNVLPWPAVSPDLSPIEHAWDEMERRLRQLPNQPVTLAELSRALVRIWNGIPQAFFTNLVGSMRRRSNACITANGGHTRYWLCDMVLETFLICWSLVMKWVFFSHFWIPWTSMKCVLLQIWNILLLSATMLLFCITFYQCTVSFFRKYTSLRWTVTYDYYSTGWLLVVTLERWKQRENSQGEENVVS